MNMYAEFGGHFLSVEEGNQSGNAACNDLEGRSDSHNVHVKPEPPDDDHFSDDSCEVKINADSQHETTSLISVSSEACIVETSKDGFSIMKIIPKVKHNKSIISTMIRGIDDRIAGRVLRKFVCQKCPYSTGSLSAIRVHIQWHVNLENKTYICDICKYTTYRPYDLSCHKRHKHSHLKLFRCHHCNKNFHLKFTLKQHIIIKHLQNREIKCLLCSYRSPCKQYTIYHIKNTHKRSTFTCSHCEKLFLTDKSLKKHLRSSHPELFTYKCRMCDYCCRQKPMLDRHIAENHMTNIIDNINSSMLSLT